jgi:V8-like Glu-specific endopeptidase
MNPSSQNTQALSDGIGGFDSSKIERSIRSKSVQFRPLYEELDLSYYCKEAVLMKSGQDRRRPVPDTTIYPFSAHGRLVLAFNWYTLYASGTLIISRYVLTAAHNIYSCRFGKEADSIDFIHALNGSNRPYGIIRVRRRFYPKEYGAGLPEDYAKLELERISELLWVLLIVLLSYPIPTFS